MCNLSVRAFFAKGASVLALLCVMAGSRAASARDRLAVVVVADGDEELGDSLTEVAISSLAERGDHELVGARELRVRLAELPAAPKLEACIVQPACLARLAQRRGRAARRDRRGSQERDGFRARARARRHRQRREGRQLVAGGSGGCGVARFGGRDGVGDLFGAKVSAPNAAVSPATLALDATSPAAGPAALRLDAQPGNADDGDKRGAARAGYLGATALALAVVAFSAAAVTGNAAEAPLLGGTRAEMQEDLEAPRRIRDGGERPAHRGWRAFDGRGRSLRLVVARRQSARPVGARAPGPV